MNLPTIIPRKRRVGRGHKPLPAAAAVSNAPVLVEAALDDVPVVLTLVFDVAVDISLFDPADIIVLDANVPVQWRGNVATQPGGANTVRITLAEDAEYS